MAINKKEMVQILEALAEKVEEYAVKMDEDLNDASGKIMKASSRRYWLNEYEHVFSMLKSHLAAFTVTLRRDAEILKKTTRRSK